MELALFVWFSQIVGSLSTLLFIVALFSTVGSLIGTHAGLDCGADAKYWNYMKWLYVVAVLSTIMFIITPKNEKQFYWIAGAYIAQQAVTSDFGKRIVSVIEKKTLEYINELEKDVKK